VADKYQVGIDIGGTFTDVVILNPASGRLFLGKRLTSTDNPARAVTEVIREMLEREGIAPAQVGKAIHGTTLVTNLIIERKGSPTGFLTTGVLRMPWRSGGRCVMTFMTFSWNSPAPGFPAAGGWRWPSGLITGARR